MSADTARRTEVQSIDRAVSVLEHLSQEGRSGVTDVANALDIHKSTAYRILATLKARGLVEQDAQTERYRLGMGLVFLARSVTEDLDLVHASRAVSERLSAQTRETVTVSVLAGNEVVVIDQTNASPSVLNVSWTGKHFPLHCTSDGKVLLAHLPEDQRKTLLREPLKRYTVNTVIDRTLVQAQLEVIRRVGYGSSIEELEVGLVGIAAPIYSATGNVVASMSVSGPTFRLSSGSVPEIGALTRRAAGEISRNLGFGGAATEVFPLEI